jgi:hypothetical protein
MKGSARKNLAMFRKLCGTDSLANVVFVTTKWDIVPVEVAEQREEQLKAQYLQAELASGAQTARHNNTAESAKAALSMVLGHKGIPLKLQQQLVHEGLQLRETDAGRAVGAENEEMMKTSEEEIEEIKKQLQEDLTQSNEALRKALEEDKKKAEEQLKKLQADKAMLEMDHARDVLAWKKRLEDVAKMKGQPSNEVLMTGVSDSDTPGSSFLANTIIEIIVTVTSELLGISSSSSQ